MAKNVLFVIHGIGEQRSDWASSPDGPITALNEAAQNYDRFKGKDLSEFIEFIPIRYDDIFDKILKGWGDLGSQLQGLPMAPLVTQAVLKVLEKANDPNVFLTYGCDVPLYRGFTLFAQRVQARVIAKIARAIADRASPTGGAPVQFSVLAHSLGTTVAHDSLHLLGTEKWPGGDDDAGNAYSTAEERKELGDASCALRAKLKVSGNPFSPEHVRFQHIFMLANTSALLHTTPGDAYSTIVHPLNGGNCTNFYNLTHSLDPISRIAAFTVPGTWKQAQSAMLNHLYDPNVHGFAHFIRNPDVHLPILAGLVNGYEADDDWEKALETFSPVGPLIATKADELKGRLEGLLVEASKDAFPALDRWINVCKGLQSVIADFKMP